MTMRRPALDIAAVMLACGLLWGGCFRHLGAGDDVDARADGGRDGGDGGADGDGDVDSDADTDSHTDNDLEPPCEGVCGDGVVECGEGCDDGGSPAGLGCSEGCEVRPGFRCSGEPSECVLLGPFGPPVLIEAVSDPLQDDDDASMTADLLEIYFESNRPGGPGGDDVWMARRSSPDEDWGTPHVVAAVSTEGGESGPRIAPNGLSLMFVTPRAGGLGNADVWIVTRSARDAAWSEAAPIAEINSAFVEGVASETPDGRILVLASRRLGTIGNLDLWESRRESRDLPWSVPSHHPEICDAQDDADPHIGSDGLWIFFASSRAGGMRGMDIWVARRPSVDAPFGTPVPLEGVNSDGWDADPWLSPDLRRIVFMSDRSGNSEIYEATR